MLLVANSDKILLISGTGDVLEPDHHVHAIGSGGPYALAAARAGDFRTAVRKLYVSLLYELGERGLIELEDSATNYEYLKKVSRFNVLVPPMRYLTDRFDYVWYGMFPSTEEEFAAYFSRYQEAMESARTLAESATAS